MRVGLAIAIAALLLGLASLPMQGQMRAGDVPALEAIHMVDRQAGWAVTDPRYVSLLLRTTDGGTYWRDVTPLRPSGRKIRVWKILVLSSHIAWVTPGDTIREGTTEIFRTIDGGRTWRSVAIPARTVKSISFINPREGWLVASVAAYSGSDEVEIYRSTDGGETWVKVGSATRDNASNGLPTEGDKSAITFLNPATGWITGVTLASNRLYLYVTHDRGNTWRQQNMPLPRELTPHWKGFPQSPTFFTARDGILPAFYDLFNDSGGEIGRVVVLYVTHDGGTTWTHNAPVRVKASDVVYQEVADMNRAWVTNGRVLHVTNDGGRRWMTMRPGSLFADVTQLDFISSRIGWAVRNTALYGGTPKFPFLLRTLDGGRTWTPVNYTMLRQ